MVGPLQAITVGPLRVDIPSPNGTTVAAGSSDGTAPVWDLASRRITATLPHPQPVISVAFGRDSHTLATGSADGVERLWRLPGPVLAGPTDAVFTVAFSPDRRTLAAGSRDKNVWLWDLAQPRRPVALDPPLTSPVGSATLDGSAAFSPDGRTLATGSDDDTAVLWKMPSAWPDHIDMAQAARQACEIIENPISQAEWARYLPGVAYRPPCLNGG